MTHYVFLAQGFEDIEALSVVDVLRRGGIDVKTVSISDSLEVESSHGVVMKADLLFSEIDSLTKGFLILPGGMPGAKFLGEHAGLCVLLKQHAEATLPVAAICAAPMVLGQLGILAGKKAVCYPGCEAGCYGAEILDAPVVVDGNVITGKGPALALPFGLAILEAIAGEASANPVAQGMLFA